jgi:hypothetical protein
MGNTQVITPVERVGSPTLEKRPRRGRSGWVLAIVALVAAATLAVGYAVTRPPEARETPIAISIPPGHNQPATRIHAISMRPVPLEVDVAPGHVQPATRIHAISMRPTEASA